MRCYYCLKDEGNLPIECVGYDENGVRTILSFHDVCYKRFQQKVIDLICRNKLEIKEGE